MLEASCRRRAAVPVLAAGLLLFAVESVERTITEAPLQPHWPHRRGLLALVGYERLRTSRANQPKVIALRSLLRGGGITATLAFLNRQALRLPPKLCLLVVHATSSNRSCCDRCGFALGPGVRATVSSPLD
jgi:hypothetical protein